LFIRSVIEANMLPKMCKIILQVIFCLVCTTQFLVIIVPDWKHRRPYQMPTV